MIVNKWPMYVISIKYLRKKNISENLSKLTKSLYTKCDECLLNFCELAEWFGLFVYDEQMISLINRPFVTRKVAEEELKTLRKINK